MGYRYHATGRCGYCPTLCLDRYACLCRVEIGDILVLYNRLSRKHVSKWNLHTVLMTSHDPVTVTVTLTLTLTVSISLLET